MAQTLNQFLQAPIQGQVDLAFSTGTVSAQVDATVVAPLIPGQAVKVVSQASGVPRVIACTAATDTVFGFVNYSLKDATFPAYAPVEISTFRDNVMYMTSNEAIAQWTPVSIVVTGSFIHTPVTGEIIIGYAYDDFTASGNIGRVFIDLPGVASA